MSIKQYKIEFLNETEKWHPRVAYTARPTMETKIHLPHFLKIDKSYAIQLLKKFVNHWGLKKVKVIGFELSMREYLNLEQFYLPMKMEIGTGTPLEVA